MHKYIAGIDEYKLDLTKDLGEFYVVKRNKSKKDSKTLAGEKIIAIFVKK